MSLEVELAHRAHQLSDAQTALESKVSQVQVSVWMSCCGCDRVAPNPTPLSGPAGTTELGRGGPGVRQEGLLSGCR